MSGKQGYNKLPDVLECDQVVEDVVQLLRVNQRLSQREQQGSGVGQNLGTTRLQRDPPSHFSDVPETPVVVNLGGPDVDAPEQLSLGWLDKSARDERKSS